MGFFEFSENEMDNAVNRIAAAPGDDDPTLSFRTDVEEYAETEFPEQHEYQSALDIVLWSVAAALAAAAFHVFGNL